VAAPSLDYTARPVLCAEELLILLVNFMKIYQMDFQDNETEIMKLEQAVLPNLCLEEEEEEDLREIQWEGVDWVHLAQDRDKDCFLMNTVMSLQVPQNAGNSLV
jgi:hypothetical protein